MTLYFLVNQVTTVSKVSDLALQVAHVTGEVQFPKTRNGKVDLGWAAAQVATTADFSHGSWFWTHFSGGLNYQVCLVMTFTTLTHNHKSALPAPCLPAKEMPKA